jgi:hypothetical protein
MLVVLKEATQRLIEQAQTPIGEGGNMPIDTGFLRASLVVTRNARYDGQGRPNPGLKVTYNDAAVAITLNSIKLGDIIHVSWVANYAVFMEFRYGFARLAIQNWQFIVNQVAREVRQ